MDDYNSELFYKSNILIYATICAIFASITYWLFCIPCNWSKKVSDFDCSGKVNLISKRNAINQMRRNFAGHLKEIPPPYPNGWFCIMESSNLKIGEIKNVFALGEHLVVYRTQENKVYTINAYCPHLGANFGVDGKIFGDTIECPFHQWRFRGSDGKCVHIPYSNCAPINVNVRTWITQEVNDNIFIWYHAEINEKPWPLPVIAKIENRDIVFQGRNEFYINCHIQEIPENGADVAHFRAVHKSNFLLGYIKPLQNLFNKIGNHYWQLEWTPAEPPNKHIAKFTLNHSIGLIPSTKILHFDITGEQVGPSYVLLRLNFPTKNSIEVLQTVTPIGPLMQKVVHRFYAPRLLSPFVKIIILGESIMFERDVKIWNNKIFRKRPQLVKEDASIKFFRNWYMQFYSENSKTFKSTNDPYDW